MSFLQSKKVSVVVPNYNYGRYLKKRINSILKQTYPVYELIILDDASTDNSLKVIERIISDIRHKYPDLLVKYVRNEKNSGKAILQWKKAFELATGEYIWIAEADDLSDRKFLEKVMEGFKDSDVVLSYTESKIINDAGLMMMPSFRWSRDREKTGHYKDDYVKEGRREIEEIMAIRCTIPNVSAAVFRKKNSIPYLKYLEEAVQFSQVGDWYFYIKVLNHGKISYRRDALNKFRVHSGSKTSDSKNDKKHFDEIVKIHKLIAIKYNVDEFVTRRMLAEEKRIAKRMGIKDNT